MKHMLKAKAQRSIKMSEYIDKEIAKEERALMYDNTKSHRDHLETLAVKAFELEQ